MVRRSGWHFRFFWPGHKKCRIRRIIRHFGIFPWKVLKCRKCRIYTTFKGIILLKKCRKCRIFRHFGSKFGSKMSYFSTFCSFASLAAKMSKMTYFSTFRVKFSHDKKYQNCRIIRHMVAHFRLQNVENVVFFDILLFHVPGG